MALHPFKVAARVRIPLGVLKSFDELCTIDFQDDPMALSKHLAAELTPAILR
jgi:hypothetical protein